MERFKFQLIKVCYQNAKNQKELGGADFFLEEDNWNDFGYHTMYHLHLTRKHAGINPLYLGPIRIMRVGQEEATGQLLREYVDSQNCLTELPEDFVALTDSLDLFQILSHYLKTTEERILFAKSLHLILGEGGQWYEKAKDDPCFTKSLCRDTDLASRVFAQIRNILYNEGIEYNLRKESVTIIYPDAESPLKLKFNNARLEDGMYLPNGIIAFIGKNGCGKSTSLYKLAYLMFSSPSERPNLEKWGKLNPADILIRKLIVLSYSPLDSFILPGQGNINIFENWLQSIEKHEGRFEYCGIRDIVKEAHFILENSRKSENKESTNEYACIDAHLHMPHTFLKNIGMLSRESYTAYRHLSKEPERERRCNVLFRDFSKFGHDELDNIADLLLLCSDEEEWTTYFNKLSTGHKFFFHAMFSVIAYIEENSLLLFDEPENHLQSPLLSFMMMELRKILFKYSSVMLVATHSPIILQCILSSNIRIVRKSDGVVTFKKPSIETFGESFGTISSEVFDMTSDRNSFFPMIDYIYEEGSPYKSAEEAVSFVRLQLHDLSYQALNYIVNKFTDSHVESSEA